MTPWSGQTEKDLGISKKRPIKTIETSGTAADFDALANELFVRDHDPDFKPKGVDIGRWKGYRAALAKIAVAAFAVTVMIAIFSDSLTAPGVVAFLFGAIGLSFLIFSAVVLRGRALFVASIVILLATVASFFAIASQAHLY